MGKLTKFKQQFVKDFSNSLSKQKRKTQRTIRKKPHLRGYIALCLVLSGFMGFYLFNSHSANAEKKRLLERIEMREKETEVLEQKLETTEVQKVEEVKKLKTEIKKKDEEKKKLEKKVKELALKKQQESLANLATATFAQPAAINYAVGGGELTGSVGYAIAYGNCVNEPGVNNPGWGNPIDWPVLSSEPTIGATALWNYNHTGVVTGIWSNGDIEVRHQNFPGGQTRFSRSEFRGFR